MKRFEAFGIDEKAREGAETKPDGTVSDAAFHAIGWNTDEAAEAIDLVNSKEAELDLQIAQIESFAKVDPQKGVDGYTYLLEQHPGHADTEKWQARIRELSDK